MKKLINILIAIFLLYNLGYAQQHNVQLTPKLKLDKSGHVKYIKFNDNNKTGKWKRPSSSAAFFKDVLNANKQDQFTLKNKREQKNSLYTEHYKQFYQGVEVEGGIFILHFSKGKLTKANGHYICTDDIDPLPKLTPEDAAKSYAAYLQITDVSAMKFLHGLVIAETEKISGADTTYNTNLCYKIDLLSNPYSKGETGYIDAHTGKILKTQKNWFNSSATGTFTTLYSGTKNARTQYYGGVYNLIDSSRNAIINTWDLNNNNWDTYSTNAVEFTDNNNNWTQEEHSANDDQMALDIHWALQEIYDYFDVEHDLQSFDDSNHMIDAFVHVEFEDNDRDNARFQWFPSGDQVFFFGDGQTIFKPIGSLDVVAHEFSHAITHNHTGWASLTTIRRAIHEGFSDIWGVVIENKVTPEKDHWKIGEEVINVAGDDCLRNIQNPESSTSYTQIADCFGDTRYNDGGNDEAYEKSEVLSYWFYLLSEGGSGINDNNDQYRVYGLGIDVAAKIVFDGQTTEFASVSSYTDARDAMIDAADDLFGESSFQSLQVANAWYAVGVGSNPGQVTLSGQDVVCYSGATFTANNPPSGSSISWSTSSNLYVQSGGNTATPFIRAKYSSSSGEGWVQPKFTSNGYTSYGSRKTVWIGTPKPQDISLTIESLAGNGYLCTDNNNTILASHSSGSGKDFVLEYEWNISNSWQISEHPGNSGFLYPDNFIVTVTAWSPNSVNPTVSVRARSACGWGIWKTIQIPASTCQNFFSFQLSPNPTSGETTISIASEDKTQKIDDVEWEMEIYDWSKALKAKQTKIRGNQYKISTSHLPTGVYTVRIKIKDQVLTEKLSVQ